MFCAIKQHSNIEKKMRFHSNKEKMTCILVFSRRDEFVSELRQKNFKKNKSEKEFKRKKSKRKRSKSFLFSFFTTHSVYALFDPIQLKLAYYFFSH